MFIFLVKFVALCLTSFLYISDKNYIRTLTISVITTELGVALLAIETVKRYKVDTLNLWPAILHQFYKNVLDKYIYFSITITKKQQHNAVKKSKERSRAKNVSVFMEFRPLQEPFSKAVKPEAVAVVKIHITIFWRETSIFTYVCK